MPSRYSRTSLRPSTRPAVAGWVASVRGRRFRDSALWNLNYVREVYDLLFLTKLESFVMQMCDEEPRLTSR